MNKKFDEKFYDYAWTGNARLRARGQSIAMIN